MNVSRISGNLRAFIKAHGRQFSEIPRRESALLELGALVLSSEHYRLKGYTIQIENQQKGRFSVKLSSRGHPYNFSWFTCQKDKRKYEIHANLSVAGAHGDGAIYVVDVAVTKADKIPKSRPKRPWLCAKNSDLITFAECKKLVVYPMLLAQFVGIVHEIKPSFLGISNKQQRNPRHFYPALLSTGYLTPNSSKILTGFGQRQYRLCVIHNCEKHLSDLQNGSASVSPFMVGNSID
jgi:hypothetical protein